MRKEGKCIKPSQMTTGTGKHEGKRRERGNDKMTQSDFLPPPPRKQLNQEPIYSHTRSGTPTERYDNFDKIISVCVARYRTKTDCERQKCS